jgi:cytochrome P450
MTALEPPTAGCPRLDHYDPLSPEELLDPYPTWERARDRAPVFCEQSLGLWFITRYEDVIQAIRDTATFSSAFGGVTRVDGLPQKRRPELERAVAGGYPDGTRFLVMTDAPAHHARRKLAQQAFTPSRVAKLETRIQSIADELCDACEVSRNPDLMRDFAYPLTTQVIAAILGLGPEIALRMRQVAEDLLVVNAPPRGSMSKAEADDVVARAHRISVMHADVQTVLRQRRAEPKEDVLSALASAMIEDGQSLDDEDILALVAEMILAGTDTTANLIAQAVLFASTDRELWRRIGEHTDTAFDVVEEALRRRGSSKGLFRITTRAVEVAGVQIPKGAIVQLLYGSANHDERRFPDPRAFIPGRPGLDQHVAFGRGTHFCLGAPLARVESRIALQTLSRRFPQLRVVDESALHYLPTITTHTLASLPLDLGAGQ